MIFQDPLCTLNPAFPVGEQIREALRLHHIIPGSGLPWPLDGAAPQAEEKERVLDVMNEVGIPSPMDRYAAYPHQFSGGMQQRALIAIGLVCEPVPAAGRRAHHCPGRDHPGPNPGPDAPHQPGARHRVSSWSPMTWGMAAEFCSRIAVMYAGRIVEQGSVDQVSGKSANTPTPRGCSTAGRVLPAPSCSVQPIPGNVPDLAALPAGCAFAPRCSFRQDVCTEGPVPLHLGRTGPPQPMPASQPV